MVGKVIKSGGTAISGQKNIDYEGKFFWQGKEDGLQGEITLLQLYKAALSKGKAYSDHKHHHVHEWDLNGEPMEDEPETPTDEPPPEPSTSEHPFLENGQLKHRLPVHELLAKGITPKPIHSLDLLNTFERFHPSTLLKLDESSASLENTFDHNFGIFKRHNADQESSAEQIPPASHESERGHKVIKRFANATRIYRRRTVKHHPRSLHDSYMTYRAVNRYLRDKYKHKANAVDTKRAYILSEHLPQPVEFQPETGFPTLYSELNGHDILDDSYLKNTIPDSGKAKVEYEPAEWEVRKIMDVCNACDDDPFKKANVLSWQETPKKLYGGAEYVPAIPKCHIF